MRSPTGPAVAHSSGVVEATHGALWQAMSVPGSAAVSARWLLCPVGPQAGPGPLWAFPCAGLTRGYQLGAPASLPAGC